MKTAMESIKEMVNVNTVVGEPIETPDGLVILPVSRVTCGFAAGGSEYELEGRDGGGGGNQAVPFGGGSGAGVSVQPVGFLVVGKDKIRLLPVDANTAVERLIDLTPQVLDRIQEILGRKKGDTVTKETMTILRPQ